jgi:hypothetical protein
MAEDDDREVLAIKSILENLQNLDPEARARVLRYVAERLGVVGKSPGVVEQLGPPSGAISMAGRGKAGVTLESGLDIKSLKQAKQPRSANQMAALVAYYLSEIVLPDHRKESIGNEDIEKYFKQASFPLPKRPDMTLANAKNAGYFDSAGSGLFRLNPVGYNLVVHSLPSSPLRPVPKKARDGASRRNPK